MLLLTKEGIIKVIGRVISQTESSTVVRDYVNDENITLFTIGALVCLPTGEEGQIVSENNQPHHPAQKIIVERRYTVNHLINTRRWLTQKHAEQNAEKGTGNE
jgi:hypothetical protein